MKKCNECGAFNPLRYDFSNKPLSGNCAHCGEFVVADQNCKMELEESGNPQATCATCKIEFNE